MARPDFKLAFTAASPLALPVGTAGGVLQGAAGISAPITISFLNAMRLERPVFIATISVFFATMSFFQLITLIGYGLLTPHLAGLGALTLLPLFLGLPVGGFVARYLSVAAFDRVMLIMLFVLALRLVFTALA
jgi:uncharacterized membrane protein YfcA